MQESLAKILSGQLSEQQQSITVPSASTSSKQQVQPVKVNRDTLHPPSSPKQFRAVNRLVINNTNAVNGVEATAS